MMKEGESKVIRLQVLCEDFRGQGFTAEMTFTEMRDLVEKHFRRLENPCSVNIIDGVFECKGASPRIPAINRVPARG